MFPDIVEHTALKQSNEMNLAALFNKQTFLWPKEINNYVYTHVSLH